MNVSMQTSLGDITIELDEKNAPLSSTNFAQYVRDGHYDGTIFHRVIDGFMIQGGGFLPDMKQKPTREGVPNEWKNGLKNKKGTLAMARVGGRPDSGTAQFFINVVDNPFLDNAQSDGAAYAVFGKVTAGMDVVDKIRAVKTTTKSGHADVPATPVVITKCSIVG